MSPLLWACAAALGVGLALVAWAMLSGRRRLSDRIAAQFGVATQPPTLTLRWLRRANGENGSVGALLRAAGVSVDIRGHQQRRLLAAVVGVAVGLGAFALVGTTRDVHPGAALVASLCLGGIAVWAYERRLRSLAHRRRARISAQFPAMAEMLALAVAAGDGIGSALARVARGLHGELGVELRSMIAEARSGVSVFTALSRLSDRLADPGITRCFDAILVAAERGTPLAAVLRDQAADARESSRRALMESAGKREIAMMAPVVFGVLPLSVLFAIYPGLSLFSLQL